MSDIVERLRQPLSVGLKSVGLGAALEIIQGMWRTGNEAADEIERLREAKRRALEIADERSKENVELRAEVRKLTMLLDQRLGTPCEQIRHQQEVEELRAEIERLRATT
jgi:succinate dehydrogenase/fumarate reductase flavoprotein subunit